MPEPSTAPRSDLLNNIEGGISSSPAQGSGMAQMLGDLSNEHLFMGRIDDTYMGSYGTVVGLYGLGKNIPCLWLQGAANRVYGAQDINAPIPTSEVLVYVPADRKFGIILGYINSPADGQRGRPVGQIAPEAGVNSFTDSNAHNSNDWGVINALLYCASGMPVDTMPGDRGFINENNVWLGIQHLLASMKGSELSKVEAFIDGLVRLTAHHYQQFTAAGEVHCFSDLGGVDVEEFTAMTQAEALGVSGATEDIQQDNPGATLRANPTQSGLLPVNDSKSAGTGPLGKEAKSDLAVGRWRLRQLRGYLAGLLLQQIVRPGQKPGSLVAPDQNPDMGMQEQRIDTSGLSIERSVVGIGMMKTQAIGVPKRAFRPDDPGGDTSTKGTQPKEDFDFKMPENTQAIGAQLRDFFAWYFNNYAVTRLLERPLDFTVPDEADCPAPGNGSAKPSLGSWTLEMPPSQKVMAAGKNQTDETKNDGKNFRPGDSWSVLTEDGGYSLKTSCGCGIEIHGGIMRLTGIKGIEIFSGATVDILAGDDLILKARKSIDMTATKGQMRLKSENEFLVTSVQGGMLFETQNQGHEFDPGIKGEQQPIPGIIFKTPGDITAVADCLTANLSTQFFLQGQKKDQYPGFFVHAQQSYFWLKQSAAWKTGDGFAMIDSGDYFGTGRVQIEGDVSTKGDVSAAGAVGGSNPNGMLNGPADWSNVPPLSKSENEIFKQDTWDKFQIPVKLQDLDNVKFYYRSSAEDATTDAQWFGTYWQQDIEGLVPWNETPVNGTWPWPGEQHYQGGQSIFNYQEVNFEKSTGRSAARKKQKASGGQFTPTGFNNLMVHPDR